jgi:hypothetical protein
VSRSRRRRLQSRFRRNGHRPADHACRPTASDRFCRGLAFGDRGDRRDRSFRASRSGLQLAQDDSVPRRVRSGESCWAASFCSSRFALSVAGPAKPQTPRLLNGTRVSIRRTGYWRPSSAHSCSRTRWPWRPPSRSSRRRFRGAMLLSPSRSSRLPRSAPFGAPVALVLVAAERSADRLAAWRRWLLGNSRTIGLVALIVIGRADREGHPPSRRLKSGTAAQSPVSPRLRTVVATLNPKRPGIRTTSHI